MIERERLQRLNPKPGKLIKEYLSALNQFVIGQDRAKEKISNILLRKDTGLRDPRRPLGVIFLLGPTGVGKTELVKATANLLFQDVGGYTHISCTGFQHGHEVTKLIGAPPSFVGYDQSPILSQDNIDRPAKKFYQKKLLRINKKIKQMEDVAGNVSGEEKERLNREISLLLNTAEKLKSGLSTGFSSLILFDEFEKGHPDVHKILLEILNEGSLSLNNGAFTDFSNSIIALTGNIASREIQKIISNSKMGFVARKNERKDDSQDIWSAVISRLEKTFPPELLGRIGKENIIVCNSLKLEETLQVLEIQLARLREFINRSVKPIQLEIEEDAKLFLVKESRDDLNIVLGARALVNGVQKRIFDPLSVMMSKGHDEGGIEKGDRVVIRLNKKNKLEFLLKD